MDNFDLMKILVGTSSESDYENKQVIIQGITGSFGSTHTRLMKGYGTNISAGVTPGKG
jgi:succinyl-CoA synthetase alpha subunit